MSAQARKDARNAKIKASQEARKKAEQEQASNCLQEEKKINHPSKADVEQEVARLTALFDRANSEVERHIHSTSEDGELHYVPKNGHRGDKPGPAHFAGPDSGVATEKLHILLKKADTAWKRLQLYRNTHDTVYQTRKAENAAKIAFWKCLDQEKPTKPSVKSSNKVHEIIHRYHNRPFDPTTLVSCRHYDRDTLERLPCDCERQYECGCQQKPKCKCGVNVCFCGVQHTVYDYTSREVSCGREDCNFYPDCDGGAIKRWKPSVRACARIAQGKAEITEKMLIRIIRNSAGFLIGTDEEGKFDEQGVRCYHVVDSCDEYVSCDCVRDETTGQFELSNAAKIFVKNGGKIEIDQRCVESARSIVKGLPPNTNMRNPHGFGGYDRPTFETISPEQKLQKEKLELMGRYLSDFLSLR